MSKAPAVWEGLIFVSRGAGMSALVCADGTEAWSLPSAQPVAMADGSLLAWRDGDVLQWLDPATGDVRESGVFARGPVIVSPSAVVTAPVGDRNALRSYSRESGALLWMKEHPRWAILAGPPVGGRGGAICFVALNHGPVAAYETESGRQLWIFDLRADLEWKPQSDLPPPRFSGDLIYDETTDRLLVCYQVALNAVDALGGVVALSPLQGVPLWRHQAKWLTSFSWTPGLLHLLHADGYQALDTGNGDVATAWPADLLRAAVPGGMAIRGPVAVTQDLRLVGATPPTVLAFARDDPALRWYWTRVEPEAEPGIVNLDAPRWLACTDSSLFVPAQGATELIVVSTMANAPAVKVPALIDRVVPRLLPSVASAQGVARRRLVPGVRSSPWVALAALPDAAAARR